MKRMAKKTTKLHKVARHRVRESQGKRMGDVMLERLVQAVVAAYPNEPTSPGIVISLLTSGEWYVSVLRYREKFGAGKYVVCSSKAKGMGDAIEAVAKDWYARHTAKRDLGAMLGKPYKDSFGWDEGPRWGDG